MRTSHLLAFLMIMTMGLSVFAATFAQAKCRESSQRIPTSNADCVGSAQVWEGSVWEGKSGKTEYFAWVTGGCTDHGDIVVRVDIAGRSDKTWRLTSEVQRKRSKTAHSIRGIYCCTEDSDICDRSEITAQACLDKYYDSPASEDCRNETASVSNFRCNIGAECPGSENRCEEGSSGDDCDVDGWKETSIIATFKEALALNSCNGALTKGDCPP